MTVAALTSAEYETASDRQTVNRIAGSLGVDPDALRGPRRHQEYVQARRVVARDLRGLGWSYPRIGRALGNRDHTTIMYLLDAIKKPQRWKHMIHYTSNGSRALCGVRDNDGQRSYYAEDVTCPTCRDHLNARARR